MSENFQSFHTITSIVKMELWYELSTEGMQLLAGNLWIIMNSGFA